MRSIRLVIFAVLVLNAFCVFSLSPATDQYYIVNASDSPVYMTIRFKYSERDGMNFCTGFGFLINFDYYEDNIFITGIHGERCREVNKRYLFPNGLIPFLALDFPIVSFPIFSLRANTVLASNLQHYVGLFHYLLEEFTIYDEESHVIMTMDDITEDSFTFQENINSYLIMLYITPELIKNGRQRHE